MKPSLTTYILLLLMCCTGAFAQEDVPVASIDIPAQNLLKFNRFLINPTFSTVNEDNSYINLYHRNQWVSFDDNFQTYLGSYSGRISDRSGLGLSIYHQKFGTIANFGAIANYAYGIRLSQHSNLTFGFNLSYYNSGVDKSNINPSQPNDPTIADLENGSLLTFQPGINLSIGSFDIGLYAEDAFDYNFKTGESLTEFKDKTFSAHLMYTNRFDNGVGMLENARFSALTRARRMGDEDLSFSGSLILDMPKLGWIQGGYDDFYGVAAGVGFNLTKRLSLGYTIEKGIRDQISNFGVTHEINFAYSFQPILTENRVFEDLLEDENLLVLEEESKDSLTGKDAEIARLQNLVDENNMIIDEMMFRQDSIEEARKNDINKRFAYILKFINDNKSNPNQNQVKKQVVDMLKEIDENAYAAAQKKYETDFVHLNGSDKKQTSTDIQSPNKRTRVSPKPVGTPYVGSSKVLTASTATTSTNVDDGAYVIANVYKGETYMRSFMDELQRQGIASGSFSHNGLNYVYLERYNNLSEARKNYLSDVKEKYQGDVWLLHIEHDSGVDQTKLNTAYANADTGNSTSVKQEVEITYDDPFTAKADKEQAFNDYSGQVGYDAASMQNGLSQCLDRYVSRIFNSDKRGYSNIEVVNHSKANSSKQYYIIANVFADGKNADRYINELKEDGYHAQIYTNPKNNYKYVYLRKFDNWSSALKSYKSNVNFKNDIWIMPIKST
ncbi:PorP/SprF family type IX secretion system membrane protein [Galbibacter sp.]|uniref:PorP/SprF family type IX secretion system membrane protein n=1 Tax=Galbibacter sp. TaxID=2918471 RepID=UPI002C53E197|nr:PorP/SprF family type IX secretion system membrane protein [Galbibacter sp.]HLV63101.1 PorP/SprF family type IX secretion system membrane protein [Galbibacter sp.]